MIKIIYVENNEVRMQKQEFEEIRKNIYDEAYNTGYNEAYKAGYKDGYAHSNIEESINDKPFIEKVVEPLKPEDFME